jgi:hypothetical protein
MFNINTQRCLLIVIQLIHFFFFIFFLHLSNADLEERIFFIAIVFMCFYYSF